MSDSPVRVCATTACQPGRLHVAVARDIAAGLRQAPWGVLSADDVQVCPQNAGIVDEGVLTAMKEALPGARLRLHATVRVMPERFFDERAWLSSESLGYYQRMGELSRFIGAAGYTFHAGTRAGHRLEEVLDQARALEQIFECRVGIEGQYPEPDGTHRWFVSTWEEYRAVMESGVPFVVDVSHLNIVAHHERRFDEELLLDLMLADGCMEIHVSDNDGRSDRHLNVRPGLRHWWMAPLAQAHRLRPGVPVFSEAGTPSAGAPRLPGARR